MKNEKFTTFKSGAMKEIKGKLRLELITPKMEKALAEVLTYGAEKYEDHNWRKGMPAMELYAAARRHMMKWHAGEDLDGESGIHHLKHAMTDIAFMIEFIGNEHLDNRYKEDDKTK